MKSITAKIILLAILLLGQGIPTEAHYQVDGEQVLSDGDLEDWLSQPGF